MVAENPSPLFLGNIDGNCGIFQAKPNFYLASPENKIMVTSVGIGFKPEMEITKNKNP
jgi:hypothetical protein